MENRTLASTPILANFAVSNPVLPHRERDVRENKTALRIVALSLVAFLLALIPTAAHAYPGGISGFSGKTGTTCTQCHSTGTPPTVTMALPASVNSGATYTLTLTAAGASGNGGLDVASTGGTFAAGTGTQILGGELVQSSGSQTHSWTFSWTAPTVTTNTTATLYGAAIDGFSGGTGTIVANTTVLAPAANPKMNLSPTSLTFNYQIGSANPAAQTVAVTSSTSTAINYTSTTATSWLTTTASGTTPGNLSIGVNPGSMAAGTYTGSVSVASTGASNSPQAIPVTLVVTAAPVKPTLGLTPASLTFNYQIGGTMPAAQTVATSSSTTTAIAYTATAGTAWLTTTASGTTPGSLSIGVSPGSMTAGTYTGSVSVASTTASNTPVSIPVTLNITAAAVKPTLDLTPSSLTFNYQVGGSTPAAQTVATSSSTTTAISYTATTATAWLTTTASGTTPGSLSIAVNPASLAAGTYTGTVSVASAGASNTPLSIPVTLNVTAVTAKPTLNLTPTSVNFSYQIGGSAPAAQTVAASSSTSTAITYTASTSTAWLSTSAGGTTPGSLSLSVKPTGLAAGTYTGSVSVAGTGASNTPLSIPVTLTVTSAQANPTLNLTPSSLNFTFQTGGANPAAKTLSVASSTSGALSYTAAASGGSWLTLGSNSGSTPGSLSASVNPAGLAAGTYTGSISVTASGASNSPQSIPVTLTVSTGTTSGRLVAAPRWISFNYGAGQSAPSPKMVSVTSQGSPLSYTAAGFGGNWLAVSPSGGTTAGQLSISVNPAGLPAGTYAGVVQISAPGSPSIDLPVVLNVGTTRGGGGGGGDDGGSTDNSSVQAMPAVNDPTQSGSVNAKWISGAGVPDADVNDPQNQGLLITKSSTSTTKASAGVVIANADGMALTALGFDIRNGSQCTARTPGFVVVTSDGVNHVVGGCSKGTKQASPAQGWTRMRFDPSNAAQATPPIASGTTVKSIHLVVDEGPDAGSGIVMVDNILINKTVIGKQ